MHLIIISDNHNSHIIFILLFCHIYESSSNRFAVIIGVNKKVMNISIHYSIVHSTYHSNQFISIPCRIYRAKIFHCKRKLIGKMPR